MSLAASWRRLPAWLRVLAWLMLGAAVALTLTSCASARSAGETTTEAVVEGGISAAGAAVGGPLWAGIAGAVSHVWNALSDGGGGSAGVDGAVLALGFFARIGHRLDQFIGWAMLAAVALLVIFPRWRAVALDFALGLPKALLALWQRDGAAAGAALKDMLLAAPRVIGALRESPRTRPKAKKRAG